MSKALVVLSGGQDSTACLFLARTMYDEVAAVTFDYGQRHRAEIAAAMNIAAVAGVKHEVVKVPGVLVGTSPLVSVSELEQYKDWQSLPGGLEKTFVPARNALFLVLAANRAYNMGATAIYTGVSADDYGGYPDCRPSFINAMQAALQLGLGFDSDDPMSRITVQTPLIALNKKATVELMMVLPGCYGATGLSHTAYDGAYPPLGKDHATLLRAKGFELAGIPDPLIVRAFWEKKMDLPDTNNYITHVWAILDHNPQGPEPLTPTAIYRALNSLALSLLNPPARPSAA